MPLSGIQPHCVAACSLADCGELFFTGRNHLPLCGTLGEPAGLCRDNDGAGAVVCGRVGQRPRSPGDPGARPEWPPSCRRGPWSHLPQPWTNYWGIRLSGQAKVIICPYPFCDPTSAWASSSGSRWPCGERCEGKRGAMLRGFCPRGPKAVLGTPVRVRCESSA